jgi:hypothetical protein
MKDFMLGLILGASLIFNFHLSASAITADLDKMTIRDMIAGMAICGIVSFNGTTHLTDERIQDCFRLADRAVAIRKRSIP